MLRRQPTGTFLKVSMEWQSVSYFDSKGEPSQEMNENWKDDGEMCYEGVTKHWLEQKVGDGS
jgi:hypothetical protein